MLSKGANPNVRFSDNTSQYEIYNLQSDPAFDAVTKSVYYTVNGYKCLTSCSQQLCPNALLDEWHYSNGVLGAHFSRVIGHGGEGRVLEGLWCGKRAAYKFVPISIRRFIDNYTELMSELRRCLNESIQYTGTQCDLIVPFYAHYRFDSVNI